MKPSSTFLIGVLLFAQAWIPHAAADAESPSGAKITFLIIYRPGPAWPQGQPVSELPLKEHGTYMLSLYAKGVMKLAGPRRSTYALNGTGAPAWVATPALCS
jgi:hypothetical protein